MSHRVIAYDCVKELTKKAADLTTKQMREDDGYLQLVEDTNKAIAVSLGFHLHEPSNFSDWTISRNPQADPYNDLDKANLIKLPDYVGDLNEAMKIAPPVYRLTLEDRGTSWSAFYLIPFAASHESERAPTAAMAVALAAVRSRLSKNVE